MSVAVEALTEAQSDAEQQNLVKDIEAIRKFAQEEIECELVE